MVSLVPRRSGTDGEAIEFEWTSFPGFTTLTILKEIQKDLESKNM